MFLRYLEGMLTRKRCPSAVSTSCRLFPGVLRTCSGKDRLRRVSKYTLPCSEPFLTQPQPAHLYYLLLVRGHHMLPQHLSHHMLSLGGLRHAGLCPGLLGGRDSQLFFQSYSDGTLRSQDCFQEKQPYTRKHLLALLKTSSCFLQYWTTCSCRESMCGSQQSHRGLQLPRLQPQGIQHPLLETYMQVKTLIHILKNHQKTKHNL